MRNNYAILGALLAFLSLNCSVDVEHSFDLNLGVEDDCLFSLPDCLGETYGCYDTSDTLQPECEVRCIAAAAMMCGEEGPECIQYAGEEVRVPVVCITK